MRERINENPVVQAALIGVMVLVFGFILVTRVLGGSEPAAEPAATTESSTAPSTDAAATGSAPTETSAVAPAPGTDTTTAPAAPAEGSEPTTGSLEAGEGMPAEVVEAYDANKVVVLLVVDSDAIDDKRVEEATKDLEERSDVALFQTDVKNVADYSQITNGVGINRTPALIVMSPRDISDVPVATVSYGFRSLESVNQAVEDAKYDGKKAPYYPE